MELVGLLQLHPVVLSLLQPVERSNDERYEHARPGQGDEGQQHLPPWGDKELIDPTRGLVRRVGNDDHLRVGDDLSPLVVDAGVLRARIARVSHRENIHKVWRLAQPENGVRQLQREVGRLVELARAALLQANVRKGPQHERTADWKQSW